MKCCKVLEIKLNNLKKNKMKDSIKKWWNREWSCWEIDSISEWNYFIILKRTSNDGLIQFKKVKKL